MTGRAQFGCCRQTILVRIGSADDPGHLLESSDRTAARIARDTGALRRDAAGTGVPAGESPDGVSATGREQVTWRRKGIRTASAAAVIPYPASTPAADHGVAVGEWP